MTEYPNREHANADKAARRRALAAISDISQQLATLTRRLRLSEATDNKGVYVDADDARPVADALARLTGELAILEALRDVREWHAADLAEQAAERAEAHRVYMHPHPRTGGPHAGWLGHNGYLSHRHDPATGETEWELTHEDGSPAGEPDPDELAVQREMNR